MPEKKVQLPLTWGPAKVTQPEDVPKWIEPYQIFLGKYGKLPWFSTKVFKLNLQFSPVLPKTWPLTGIPLPGDVIDIPGDAAHVHGRTISPFTIRLSMRAHSSLFFGLRPAPGTTAAFIAETSRGARVLFNCFAHLEAINSRPLVWPFLWAQAMRRPAMQAEAEARGSVLLEYWAWNMLGCPATPIITPSPAPTQTHVLVVEDVEMYRIIAARMLENQNCYVTLASSGYEAIRLAAHRDFDIILMDLNMPGLDGREVTRAFREMGCDMPILSITGEEPDQLEDIRAGIDGAMYKSSWTPTGVAAMLERWAPHKR